MIILREIFFKKKSTIKAVIILKEILFKKSTIKAVIIPVKISSIVAMVVIDKKQSLNIFY